MSEVSKRLYDLELHKCLELDDSHLYNTILRVPGGWIYRSFDKSCSMLTSCFVPFNNEFLPCFSSNEARNGNANI